jgi:hypothetical protein
MLQKARYTLSHKVFQDGTLACTLTTHDRNLWQVDRAFSSQLSECVLQLINDDNQVVHPPVSHVERLARPELGSIQVWRMRISEFGYDDVHNIN